MSHENAPHAWERAPGRPAPAEGGAAAAEARAERFGRAVATRLQAGADELPHDIRERLRAARVQALARRKPEPAASRQPQLQADGSAVLLGAGPSWWRRLACLLPLLALVAGLLFLHRLQVEEKAAELAQLDAALLTDDLPPAAWADPGFVQFLKLGRE